MVEHADRGTAEPAAAATRLAAIEETGRDALRDMRRLLGVLREEA